MKTTYAVVQQKILPFIPLILWTGILIFFSSQNGSETAAFSRRLVTFLCDLLSLQTPVLQVELTLRTLAHIFVFAIEGFLLFLACRSRIDRTAPALFWTVAICLPLSVLDELHKVFIPGRHSQWREMLLNFCGAMAGALLAVILSGLISKKKKA